MRYWLLKTEPQTFGIDNLIAMPDQITPWEGVRNFQARNFLRDEMKIGDQAFFYHSSCKVPGIVGVVEVVTDGYPDSTALNPESQYYDVKSTQERPIWFRVDVKFIKKFKHIISIKELRDNPALSQMILLQKGNRLSVMPVSKKDWTQICQMARAY